jgi:hypothetical protein
MPSPNNDINTIDTSIDNYSVIDIFEILNLPDPTIFNVKDKANDIIARMRAEGNTELVDFFVAARDKAVAALENTNTYVENQAQDSIDDIWKMNNVDDAKEATVDYFTNISQNVIERPVQPLGQQVNAPPIIARHIVNIDSQYRTTILPYVDNPQAASFNTNFTFSLSNPITKAVAMTLYSYQLPTTWYAFNARSGNTFFVYNGVIINIPDGNYTPEEMVTTINNIALQNVATSGLVVSYDSNKNKIIFTNTDVLSEYVTVTFYIQENVINFNNCGNFVLSNFQTLGVNTTLGWYLGFHQTPDSLGNVSYTINSGQSITATSQISVYGSKYFILSIEDYNSRLSGGLYNIKNSKGSAPVSIPDFYDTIHVDCETREGSLTRAQQYSITAVKESSTVNNNVYGFSNQLSGPTSGSAFAIIPLVGITSSGFGPYTKLGVDLAIFKRSYAAPTILERFTVRLTDDKGNLVNLNDNDWSFQLIVEEQLN